MPASVVCVAVISAWMYGRGSWSIAMLVMTTLSPFITRNPARLGSNQNVVPSLPWPVTKASMNCGLMFFILDSRHVLHPAPEGARVQNTSRITIVAWHHFERGGDGMMRVLAGTILKGA